MSVLELVVCCSRVLGPNDFYSCPNLYSAYVVHKHSEEKLFANWSEGLRAAMFCFSTRDEATRYATKISSAHKSLEVNVHNTSVWITVPQRQPETEWTVLMGDTTPYPVDAVDYIVVGTILGLGGTDKGLRSEYVSGKIPVYLEHLLLPRPRWNPLIPNDAVWHDTSYEIMEQTKYHNTEGTRVVLDPWLQSLKVSWNNMARLEIPDCDHLRRLGVEVIPFWGGCPCRIDGIKTVTTAKSLAQYYAWDALGWTGSS